MKSRTWILILAAVFAVCLGLSVWLMLPAGAADRAEVWSDGERIAVLELSVDQVLTVEGKQGSNVVTVSGGKIAVTAADCPDGYCMHRGFCNSGTAIVCLPNSLVIKFVDSGEVDAAVG